MEWDRLEKIAMQRQLEREAIEARRRVAQEEALREKARVEDFVQRSRGRREREELSQKERRDREERDRTERVRERTERLAQVGAKVRSRDNIRAS